MGKLDITWMGHSCFVLDNGEYRLAIDPYKPEMVGYPPYHVTANGVIASHSHGDHNYFEAVDLMDEMKEGSDVKVCKIRSYHDDEKGSLRGENTIHKILTNDISVCHLGDLGHLLSPERDQPDRTGGCADDSGRRVLYH